MASVFSTVTAHCRKYIATAPVRALTCGYQRNSHSLTNSGTTVAKRLFASSTMTKPVPSEFMKHFCFSNYHLIQNSDMLSKTGGKFGHLFVDNLMKREGFDMDMYINVSKDLLEGEGAEPCITQVQVEEYRDIFWGDKTRDFVTQYVYIVNVGSLCCGHMGVWHGGVTSAIFDNAFGILGCTLLSKAATKYINIQFRAPVMVGDSVAVVVSFDPVNISGEKKDRFVARGEMYNQRGVLVATGESELVDVSAKWKTTSMNAPQSQ